jgi:tRNA A-37 threonylcarbamoyl transferase component Bud32
VPAIIISEARGIPLSKLSPELQSQALVATKIGYDEWSHAGIIHGDPRPEHVFYDGKRVMFIDLDCAELDAKEDDVVAVNTADYGELQRAMTASENYDMIY